MSHTKYKVLLHGCGDSSCIPEPIVCMIKMHTFLHAASQPIIFSLKWAHKGAQLHTFTGTKGNKGRYYIFLCGTFDKQIFLNAIQRQWKHFSFLICGYALPITIHVTIPGWSIIHYIKGRQILTEANMKLYVKKKGL